MAAVEALELPALAEPLVAAASRRVGEAQATAEFKALAKRIGETTATPAELAEWIAAHPDHPQELTARQLLITAHLAVTGRTAVPTSQSALAASDVAAIKAASAYLVKLKSSGDVQQEINRLLEHLQKRYVSRKAFAAALVGLDQILALELPASSRLNVLLHQLSTQSEAGLHDLKAAVHAGTLQPGPLPDQLVAVTKTVATINQEFPSTPAWAHQVSLAAGVLELADRYPWPAKVTTVTPPYGWAVDLLLPAVRGTRDDGVIEQAAMVIQSMIGPCNSVEQRSARGLGTAIHAEFIEQITPDYHRWPEEILRQVDLLAADADAEFQDNLRLGETAKNEKLSNQQKRLLGLLSELVVQKPSMANDALQHLAQHLTQWQEARYFEVVEAAYEAFAAKLPGQVRSQARFQLAKVWFAQMADAHRRMLTTGFLVPQQLDPLALKSLKECYSLLGTLGTDDPLRGQVQQFRQQIIEHYAALQYMDVVEAAIRVQGEPVMAERTESMELELAELKRRLALQQLQRQLKQHSGRDQLTLTPAFNEAIAAFKKFITDHPHSQQTASAVESLFGMGQIFEQYEAWLIAAEIYGGMEKFALGVERLAAQPHDEPNVAERAAVARAMALHAKASHTLRESNRRKLADAPPPQQLSEEFQAAIAAWQKIVADYQLRPAAQTAIGSVMSIAQQYAALDAWDVADGIYAALLGLELPLRAPERLEFARAICQLGKVLPDHARALLSALSISGQPQSSGQPTEEMLAANDPFGPAQPGGEKLSDQPGAKMDSGEKKPGKAAPAEPAPAGRTGPSSGLGFGGMGGGGFGRASGDTRSDFDQQQIRARGEADARLLAAVQNQLARQAQHVAMLRDETIQHRLAEDGKGGLRLPAPAVLSVAELKRQEQTLDAVYVALQAIRNKYEQTATAQQARSEIFVLVNHWRQISQWERAAQLAQRYLTDNPTDIDLPVVRQQIARDLLAWAADGVKNLPRLSKQEMLDEIGKRFDAARDELQAIVAAFPDETALRQQAQWDIANSFLTQARVVTESSPTLARGQFVRAATELLRVAELYHDHPQIDSIPNMLWSISEELVSRGYHDEAISVWNELTIHYPTHALADQAALRIAQTGQQLGQPLRAVEAYLELNFARGGNDEGLQNTIFQIAVGLKNEKRWIEALHVLETFVDSFPVHASAGQALTMIGQIHQSNEVWEDAIAAYRRVIDEFDSGAWTIEARWAIAECTINLSRWQPAIGAYAEFQQFYPDDARVAEAARRIEVLKTLDRYQDVVDEKGQPKAFDAQFQIAAIVRTQLQNPVKAIIEYRKTAANWPESHLADDALFEIGEIYLELGETEAARRALLQMAERYPASPQADDALLLVGTSYTKEADRLAVVDRGKSQEMAREIAQRQAYQVAQGSRREQLERNQDQLNELKNQGRKEEAANKEASIAARALQFDAANTAVISNWAAQQEASLTASQLADRQDRINAALRKAVASFRQAASVTSADKADDALLQMAQIYDERLKDAESAMATWEEIVKQYSGTTVAEDASWKIANYYEKHEEFSKAIDAYQTFLRNYRRSPRADIAQAAIAENYEHLGKWVQAMDAYTNYLNNFPDGTLTKKARDQINWIKTYRL